MSESFKLTIDPDGIARLVFDYPGEKVNKISLPVLEELDSLLEGIKDNRQIKALVVTSAKEGIFIAGADLKSFEGLFNDFNLAEKMIQMGHDVFNKLEDLPFPSIAVINGVCLGGGLELALACTYRIVGDNSKTSLGLPETNLGIFPGWGGTQRLPRLVGLMQGLTMILTGSPVDAKKAFKIRLADAIVPSAFIETKTEEFVREVITEKGRAKVLDKRKPRGLMSLLLERNPIGRAFVFWKSRRSVIQKTKGQYPSPLAALDLIKETYTMPLKKGLKKEVQAFIKSMSKAFKYAPNLIYIFFNSEAMKKDPGLPGENVSGKPVNSVGVLGAGVMGSGIAWLMSYRDIPVRMKDINWEAVGQGYKAIWDTYKVLIKKRKLRPAQANRKFHYVAGAVDYSGFDKLDLVIEAAVENLELKHKILQELEANVRPDAIIATNTSSLTIEELAPALKHPERLVGMHFFNPPARMPLVEIVAGPQTSREAVQTVFELCLRLKKTPVVVGDCSGFLVNRVFAHGFIEIMRMFEEGVPMERLDKLFLKFGLPMAPFVLADEIGNDVNLKAMRSFEKAYGIRMEVPKMLEAVNDKGLYGKKVGKGFYIYQKGSKKPNPDIYALVPKKETANISDTDAIDRVTLAMINEAARCLEEKVITNPGYLDMALVFGVGFPPFRGGLLRYADSIGIDPLMDKFKHLQNSYGERFSPCEKLKAMHADKRGFF
jgi:3-hydroxyacyl-CoA dehydrogenase / enoyl-CoA hydratase / 3-hydroxybutyryl-CoA epimerase